MNTCNSVCIESKLKRICPLGEGTHALIDVPANTVFALYGGLLKTEEEDYLVLKGKEKKRIENKWGRNYPLQLDQWRNT